ncbi:hypothetical protein H5410_030465 [Solanum commersonii]|uniref:Uncharacterized protein n=1 Tax=Solanum commersonii TaxID=4109 RepID=A0A9J5YGY8_SOLCO|nr:hypothetical protein H5410_030465 [Solanum commersonii]
MLRLSWSKLQTANDSLVFCEAEVDQIRHLREILVNWNKRSLYQVNQVINLQSFAKNLGCQVGTLPTKYLGIPLGAKRKSVDSWNEVIERCDKKLARLILIDAVLDALPNCMIVVFPIPRGVEKKLDKLRSNTENRSISHSGEMGSPNS